MSHTLSKVGKNDTKTTPENLKDKDVTTPPLCQKNPSESQEMIKPQEEKDPRGILKPDIVFFGEGLGDKFHNSIETDKVDADLLIMMGSSLKVKPVGMIPSVMKPRCPQILINREPLRHLTPD